MSDKPTPSASVEPVSTNPLFLLSTDWWAVLVALILVVLVATGILGPVTW